MRKKALTRSLIRYAVALAVASACAGQAADNGGPGPGAGGTGEPSGVAGAGGRGGAAGATAGAGGSANPVGVAGAGGGGSGGAGVGGTGGTDRGGVGGTGGTSGEAGAAGSIAGSAGAAGTAGAAGAAGGSAGSTGHAGAGGSAGSAGSTGKAGTGGTTGAAGAAGTGAAGTGTGGAAANTCPVKLEGWATVNADGVNGTTGGGTAAPTTVTTFADLKAAVQDSKPRVIIVNGTIKTTDGGGSALSVASNKTIIGANKNATIYGGITMSNVSNVIVRNLNIQGTWPNSGPDDTVASHGSDHIWYDHLNIWDSTDGSLDITNASNYQTVSWTKFWYTSVSHPHRLASLNGSGGGDHPEDSRYLKVTYHHNWWGQYVNERMPRVMYGKGHQYNNYFNSTGNLYCIGVGSFGSILVENNYFKNVQSPHQFMYDWHAYIAASGNVYDNTTGTKDTGMHGTRGTDDPALNAGVEDAAPFTPPYAYAMDKAADVPTIVQKCAGPQ
jgi:pectate lyase